MLVENPGRIKIHKQRGMEKAPENGKESSLSAHASGMNDHYFETNIVCHFRLVIPVRVWAGHSSAKFFVFLLREWINGV
jgi:hypothetical protein